MRASLPNSIVHTLLALLLLSYTIRWPQLKNTAWFKKCANPMQVFHYALPSPSASPASSGALADSRRYVQALDGALPADLLRHLQEGFKEGSAFWREHDYGRVGYFSYMHPLVSHAGNVSPPLALVDSQPD